MAHETRTLWRCNALYAHPTAPKRKKRKKRTVRMSPQPFPSPWTRRTNTKCWARMEACRALPTVSSSLRYVGWWIASVTYFFEGQNLWVISPREYLILYDSFSHLGTSFLISTFMRIHETPCKSMKVHANLWQSMRFHGNPWKSMRYHENKCRFMRIHGNL